MSASTKPPPYTALSYCWEDQTPDQNLRCGGSTLLVTPNVRNFLSYFSTVETHYIWIDGVCINQIDISEKNHQVSFMKHVYTKASNVVIWLGESDPAIDVAIQKIPEIVPLADNYSGAKDGCEDALKRYGIPIRGGLFWKGVEALLSKPWFSRLWTFQEAVLPEDVEIRCGRNILSYDLMTEFTRALGTDKKSAESLQIQTTIWISFKSGAAWAADLDAHCPVSRFDSRKPLPPGFHLACY